MTCVIRLLIWPPKRALIWTICSISWGMKTYPRLWGIRDLFKVGQGLTLPICVVSEEATAMFLMNTFSKNNKKICKSLKILVTPIGFEPITCPLGGKTILIISPTSAIGWYFNENEWEKNILSFLKENLSDGLFKKIKIRDKPNEPIVDMTGKY